MSKPVVAVTMGDPSGIGPEVVVKAARDAAVLERADAPRWPAFVSTSAAADAPVLLESVTRLKPAETRPGRPAMATAPISKKSLDDAGPPLARAHRAAGRPHAHTGRPHDAVRVADGDHAALPDQAREGGLVERCRLPAKTNSSRAGQRRRVAVDTARLADHESGLQDKLTALVQRKRDTKPHDRIAAGS